MKYTKWFLISMKISIEFALICIDCKFTVVLLFLLRKRQSSCLSRRIILFITQSVISNEVSIDIPLSSAPIIEQISKFKKTYRLNHNYADKSISCLIMICATFIRGI